VGSEPDILDLVYDAPIAPDGWVAVLRRLVDIMSGSFAALIVQDQVTGNGQSIDAYDDPARHPLYFGYFGSRNPLLKIRDLPARPRVFTDEEKISRRELESSEYYNDYLLKQDMHSLLIARIVVQDSHTSCMNIARSRRRELFGAPEIEITTRLLPHLIRAAHLTQRFAAAQELSCGLGGVIDHSREAAFLVSGSGKVRYMNPAGEALLLEKRGITVRSGALSAANEQVTSRLRGLIAAAARPNGERRSGAMALPRPGHRLPLSLIVNPVRQERFSLFFEGPWVLVSIADPDAGISASERRIREVLGLTRTEARVALKLLEGCDTREAAEALGISFYTVRAHLARIFGKTGTERQAELVSLLTRLSNHLREMN